MAVHIVKRAALLSTICATAVLFLAACSSDAADDGALVAAVGPTAVPTTAPIAQPTATPVPTPSLPDAPTPLPVPDSTATPVPTATVAPTPTVVETAPTAEAAPTPEAAPEATPAPTATAAPVIADPTAVPAATATPTGQTVDPSAGVDPTAVDPDSGTDPVAANPTAVPVVPTGEAPLECFDRQLGIYRAFVDGVDEISFEGGRVFCNGAGTNAVSAAASYRHSTGLVVSRNADFVLNDAGTGYTNHSGLIHFCIDGQPSSVPFEAATVPSMLIIIDGTAQGQVAQGAVGPASFTGAGATC